MPPPKYSVSTTAAGLGPDLVALPAGPFAEHRFGVGRRRNLAAHRDGEVAVAAAPGAEGDVDVDVHAVKY